MLKPGDSRLTSPKITGVTPQSWRRGLVRESAATAPEASAAVVGWLGSFISASGDLSAQELGANSAGCPNIRFNQAQEEITAILSSN